MDVRREVDVIEELLRVYGYNNINFKNKLNASIATTTPFEDYKIQATIGDFLAAKGFNEILTNSLSNPNYNNLNTTLKEEQTVKIINPLSNDLSVMRKSLLFSGLESVVFNSNRKRQNLKFFEFGKSYHVYNAKYVENKHLTLYVTGNKSDENWVAPAQKISFFTLKSYVEATLQRLGISNLTSKVSHGEEFAEGLILSSQKTDLVEFGTLKKSILKAFDLKNEVLFADFKWDAILELIAQNSITYKEISKFPEVKRDFALLLNEEVSFKDIYDLSFETEKSLLQDVSLFDVYTGSKLPKGKKSYAVSFTLKSEKETLTDKQIEKIMGKFQEKFETKLGAELR